MARSCVRETDPCRSMKHDAIVEQGIPIHERVPIPDELIPEDSRVEIDAKIASGYCKFHHLSATFYSWGGCFVFGNNWTS